MPYTLPASDPLGTDLRLTPNGDLIINASGSLDVVTLADNVAQAVRVMLTTVPSTYKFGTGVGTILGQFVDRPITDKDIEAIKGIVYGILVKENRITEIKSTQVDASNPNMLIITVVAIVAAAGIVQIPIIVS